MKQNLVYPRISTAVSKLGSSIATVNLPAKVTCNPDAPCVTNGGCYACKGRFMFPSIKQSHSKNLEAYLKNPKAYFTVIDTTLQMIPYHYFRWHSSGDIVDMNYLDGMCKLARKHRTTKFLCFTKKYELANEYFAEHTKPSNLTIVFSNWGDWQCENPLDFPVANIRFNKNDPIPANGTLCPKFCGDCVNTNGSCWDLKKGQQVIFDKH